MKSFTFLSDGGSMGQLIRERDWAATPLGEPAHWPASLRTVVAVLLGSGHPMYIAWGPDFTQIYNDAFRPILGSTKHPAALGISTVETFREIWDLIGPMFRNVMDTGRATTHADLMVLLERHGFREECYFTFSYSAIPSDEGIGGVLVTCLETTDRVIQERRLRVLRDLLEARNCDSLQAIAQASAAALARDPDDLPFVLFFEVAEDGSHALRCQQGLQGEALAGVEQELRSRLAGAALGSAQLVELAAPVAGGLTGADPVQRVACIGVAAPGRSAPQLVLVAGLSPRLEYSQRYDEFVRGVTANIGTVIAEAEALEHERRRAQELAEIDHAKTVFFSDVSHEFRTPIALMLGPIGEAIEATSGGVRENLLIARRNTERLLKLVNSLLDFSRIEAGRMQANVERIDLAQFTCELASNFRSATDRAGIALVVDAPPLAQPVGIDSSMWEKIVLNLLSNAFKHTFEGEIRVRLRQVGGQIRLEVADTGVGIPGEQVAHVFERFHRVPNARSRTHEGSGIGLALVRELARMHGGDVEVASREGEGSVFTVTVRADLQQASAPARPVAARPQAAAAYVEEALRWLPEQRAAAAEEAVVPVGAGKVLVVDDNADMREYLRRLVAQRWTVRTAPNGEDALEQARRWLPDLIVSDVMMPRLDGFALIRRLREGEATAAIPVLLLSARAGEDARIDGMRAGADDYLVKPFSARDLLARIEAQLARARGRQGEQQARLRLSRLFEQAPVAIALLQCPEFTYTIANRPYRELVGREQLLGRTVREALPELEGQGIYEALEQVRVTQTPFVGESTHLNLWRKGVEDEGWFTFLFQPIVDPTGATEAVLVIVYEVTELARAKQAAEVANVAKDEFLAMLGHELRNPLAPIVTALQIMSLRDAGEPTRERQIIERQVKHLMRLVDDLLDVSRVTQGKLELKRETVEIAQVVGDAVEQVKPLLERRKQQIMVSVAASGLAVDGDPKRLAQVVSNLLTNASKFSGEGALIRVAAIPEAGEVVLRVIDQGIGLAASQLPRVFDVFYQGRQTFDRSEGGLGLGLAIVRNIVALHGGTVGAESAGPGQGSEFVVRLPLLGTAAPAAHSVVASAARPLPCKRILVVDDNRDAATTLAELLKLHGHATRVAFDAPTALALAAEFRPEAAFLDLGLPGMSGYELAQALWALPQLGALPVFAVSGYGQREDRRRTAHQGFTGHLVKPVSSEQLAATLQELFRPQATAD